jgi:hypothetical protein
MQDPDVLVYRQIVSRENQYDSCARAQRTGGGAGRRHPSPRVAPLSSQSITSVQFAGGFEMLSHAMRSWLVGGSLAATTVLAGASVALGADLSTTALLLAVGVSSAAVIVFIGGSAPKQTVAEILYSLEKDGRS